MGHVDELVDTARAAASYRETAGRAIAALRRDHGWTIDRIVASTGISRGSAGRWSEPYLTEGTGDDRAGQRSSATAEATA